MTFCKHCYDPKDDFIEPIRVVSSGDESWNVCPNCQAVESDTVEIETGDTPE